MAFPTPNVWRPDHEPARRLPKLVCAWCRKTLREGVVPVSHGICEACAEAVLRDAEPSIGKAAA